MFELGVLTEKFHKERERKTQKPLPQEAQPQEAALATDMAEKAESQQELLIQDESVVDELTQAEDAYFFQM